LKSDGELDLYNRSAASLVRTQQVKVKLKPGFNRVAFEGEGNTVEIKVNGDKVMTQVAQGLSEGGAGIAALGVGTFSFTNFEATGYKRDVPPPAASSAAPGGAPASPTGGSN